MKTVDLNCDLGEGFGAWEMGNDAAMIELATSVNVACFISEDTACPRIQMFVASEVAMAERQGSMKARLYRPCRRPDVVTVTPP